jgi:hypothetical protein
MGEHMGKGTKIAVRDKQGRFVAGHGSISPGRPSRAKETRYLQIMHDVVDDETWAKICARAAQDAIDGSHPARRWLGDYMVGPPIKQSQVTVSNTLSLTGPALDRRVKQIMAVFAAVLVTEDDTEENTEQIGQSSMIDDRNVIDGEIVKNDE